MGRNPTERPAAAGVRTRGKNVRAAPLRRPRSAASAGKAEGRDGGGERDGGGRGERARGDVVPPHGIAAGVAEIVALHPRAQETGAGSGGVGEDEHAAEAKLKRGAGRRGGKGVPRAKVKSAGTPGSNQLSVVVS